MNLFNKEKESADMLSDTFQSTKKSKAKEEKVYAPLGRFPTPERRLL